MPDTLEGKTRKEGLVGIVETDGYINDTEAERVAKAGHALIDGGLKQLVINIERSRIINSIGISVLIELIERLREMDGKVAFCCASRTTAKTFKIMGLLKVAEIHDTEVQAVQALRKLA